MHGGQTGEGGTDTEYRADPTIAQLGAVHAARVRGQQSGHVVRGRLVLVLGGMQDCGGPPHAFPVLVGLHVEVDDARRLHRRDGADGVCVIEQQHLLEADVADFGRLAEDRASRGQRHLAVGGPRKGSHIVDLVVAQPGLGRGADLALPDVALRFLLQAHMRAHQRMHRNRATAACSGILTVAGQQQPTVRPGRQRRVHQPPIG